MNVDSDVDPRNSFAPTPSTAENVPVTTEISSGAIPERDELADLYDTVGWVAYTKNMEALERAMQGSAHVVTARKDGRLLVTEALAPFEAVRQKVLMTDDEPGQRAFYESLGFAETRDLDDGPLRAFVKFG